MTRPRPEPLKVRGQEVGRWQWRGVTRRVVSHLIGLSWRALGQENGDSEGGWHFCIVPFSILGGGLQVQDELEMEFRLIAESTVDQAGG